MFLNRLVALKRAEIKVVHFKPAQKVVRKDVFPEKPKTDKTWLFLGAVMGRRIYLAR